ncbi:MAG TPA: MmcQ/YjbR family DNA-binding protein [Steroidobacteraceae bacterium]|jgi:predicted DNA-binding protein (MmcQ/YjbR family)|nr:MmcQ/YjbR family DNA-binding protein [Steroidobacteraceae bacterium]
MAERTIRQAVRELCLAFPEAEEFESHGSPNYRARLGASKGKVFAVWALNHHGDGHVGLWLNTPALEQSHLLASSKHLYKPPYVGPSGWIGVELNKGMSWKRVRELVHLAYLNSSPPKLAARAAQPPAVAAPTVKMKPAEIDRLLAPRARKAVALMRKICAALPEVNEGSQMGSLTWRAGKRTFFMLYDYGKGLAAQFWVGIERQGPLEMDPRLSIPPYMGHKGWMALDLTKGTLHAAELRGFAVESYRHLASRRAVTALDAGGVA